MPYEKAVLYASLATDFSMRSKQVFHELYGKTEDSDLMNFRFRSQEGTEIITTVCNDYLLVVIQNCTGKPWRWADEGTGGEQQ